MNDDGVFDGPVASTYDAIHGGSDSKEVQLTVDALYDLASCGPALEFAIGTGRIAIPLQERGIPVSGIELSRAMVAELAKKPGSENIPVAIGDMTSVRVEGEFSLVYLVYNTIDNLTSQDAQVACFQNAARHLKAGGRFVIETLIPPIQKIPFGETKLAYDRSDAHWGIDEFDVVSQQYTSHHLRLFEDSYRSLSVPFRYAWPSEMDLMARIAGLQLESRWSDWQKSPLTNTSAGHVSVWKKPDI